MDRLEARDHKAGSVISRFLRSGYAIQCRRRCGTVQTCGPIEARRLPKRRGRLRSLGEGSWRVGISKMSDMTCPKTTTPSDTPQARCRRPGGIRTPSPRARGRAYRLFANSNAKRASSILHIGMSMSDGMGGRVERDLSRETPHDVGTASKSI